MPVGPVKPLQSKVRWWILALLFLATTINYLDRIAFGFLIPEVRKDMKIDEETYGYLTSAFELTYTVGFLLMGKFVDRYGTRLGYALSIAWWSAAALLHALARTPISLGVYRALLGLGESGNFPAAIKSVAEWFPRKDRAFATGIFNAGTNVASMIGPPVFAMMVAHFGWRGCFLVTGALGFVWLVLWLAYYRTPDVHPDVSEAELTYIRGEETEAERKQEAIGWVEALGYRETWGFALAKLLSDPVWRFYSYWLPVYLYDARGFDMKKVGWVLPFIYLMADVGSVGGGWLSGFFLKKGYSFGRSRKMALATCAALMPIAVTAVLVPDPILAIVLMSLGTAAHQGWSANLFTTTSDVFPRPAVGSVTGIGGFAGGVGSIIFATLLPGLLIGKIGYKPIFLFFGLFHLSGLLVLHLLMGDLKPVLMRQKPQ